MSDQTQPELDELLAERHEGLRQPCHHFDYGVKGKPFDPDGWSPPWDFNDPDYQDNYVSEYDSCNCHSTGCMPNVTEGTLLVKLPASGYSVCVGSYCDEEGVTYGGSVMALRTRKVFDAEADSPLLAMSRAAEAATRPRHD